MCLSEIVNTQNLQIQAMYDFLDAKRLRESDNCDVMLETVEEPLEAASGASATATGLVVAVALSLIAAFF